MCIDRQQLFEQGLFMSALAHWHCGDRLPPIACEGLCWIANSHSRACLGAAPGGESPATRD